MQNVYLCSMFHLETRPNVRKKAEINEFKGLKIMATKKYSRSSGGRKDEVVISFDITQSLKQMLRERQSGGASFPQSGQTDHRLAELEQQRRNLLFLVCRILQAAPEYRLHPSELAADVVGDLSCLSQESEAYLRNRMVRDSAFQNSIAEI